MKSILLFFVGLYLIGCTSPAEKATAVPTVEVYTYYPDGSVKSIGNYKDGKQKPSADGFRIYGLYTYGELVSVIDTLGFLPFMTPAETGGMIGFCTNTQKQEIERRMRTDYSATGVADLAFLWSAEPLETGNGSGKQFALYAIQLPKSGALVDNQDLYAAEAIENTSDSRFRIDVTFVGHGLSKVQKLTKANTGRYLAMVIGKSVYEAPKIANQLDGRILTIASVPKAKAKELEKTIRARILNGEWRSYDRSGKLRETRKYESGQQM